MGGPREREREHLGHYSDLLQAMFHGPKSSRPYAGLYIRTI